MLQVLVESALENRCLSVESEGLIRQMLAIGRCNPKEAEALKELQAAIRAGAINREAQDQAASDQFVLI
ncbi:hypothetical protein [Myxacorys almedinensis]|uniref:Uncharacterized protein n=1 Tax=Myxacorys almedinensis A TaxID=2690445 RepID=A0A8J7Z158_9CYAN|nr:hypothetical protein [Myxacorys almedinensis]NDJ16238.1 hypothetical protein [Myxacorys almedinensis A]